MRIGIMRIYFERITFFIKYPTNQKFSSFVKTVLLDFLVFKLIKSAAMKRRMEKNSSEEPRE